MPIDAHLDQLTASARAVISAGYWTRPAGAIRRADKETEFVTTLIESCVGPLTQAWDEILKGAGLDLTVRGLFLHQRPKVRFPSPTVADCGAGFCELADLLIVHDHERTARRAVLVQAKTVPGDAVTGDQKDLYERWDSFRFAAGAKGRTYGIAPNDEGCRYGIVRIPPPGLEEPWLAEQPLATRQPDDFGRLLAEMLAATVAGRAVPARPATIGGNDDWSVLIDDLLSVSLTARYPLKGFWPAKQRRYFRGDLPIGLISWHSLSDSWEAVATSSSSVDALGPYDPGGGSGEPSTVEREGPEGISVIHLSTSETRD